MSTKKRQCRKNTYPLDIPLDIDLNNVGTYVRFDRANNLEFWWGQPGGSDSVHNITVGCVAARKLLWVLAERFPLDGLGAV